MNETSQRRDRRVMNAMNAETVEVHRLLERWGDSVRQAWRELDFPSETWLERWIVFGVAAASQQGNKPPALPDDLLMVDKAVADLDEPIRVVIFDFYTLWQPPEALARRRRLSVDEWGRRLSRGRKEVRSFIRGFVSANKLT